MFKDLVVRPACQESLKDVRPEDQLELVRVAGGYGEVIIDNVGVARNICSLEEVRNEKKHINTMPSIQGWEPKSADRALGVLLISHLQSPVSFFPRRIFRNQFYFSTSRNSIL